MTQDEKDKFARSLNITPETCPQVWWCDYCGYTANVCNCEDNGKDWQCTLPSPLSDDPAADFWVGPMMRKLRWPCLVHLDEKCRVDFMPDWHNGETAALYGAVKAGE